MIILPISVYAILFNHELIGILFERGRFDSHSRIITSEILIYQLAGLIFLSGFYIQNKVFIALKLWGPFALIRALSLIIKCVIGILIIKSNWALAIGGGTIAMFALGFFALECYLILKMKLRYSISDIGKLMRALLSAVVAIFIIIITHTLFEYSMGNIVLLIITAITGFTSLIAMDLILDVTGINLKRRLYIKK
jgi:putative peptidoglycan lipid II flippase